MKIHKKKNLILNQVVGDIQNSLFKQNARDNASEPYFYLQKQFLKKGYCFEGLRDQCINDVSCAIYWDSKSIKPRFFPAMLNWYLRQIKHKGSTRDLLQEIKDQKIKKILKILVLFEPPSVDEGNFDIQNHNFFDVIFTWNPLLIDYKKYYPIKLPSPISFPPSQKINFSKKKLLVDISSYKYNNHERSLSKFRIDEIRFFELNHSNEFDLYGEGWNLNFFQYLKKKLTTPSLKREYFSSYRGIVRNKSDLYSNYKFCFCYENIYDEPGFVSVKIFDAIRSGCIPIYLGANDIKNYVNQNCFIDRRNFSNTSELYKFISNMKEDEFNRYVKNGKIFISSSSFTSFLSHSFSEDIISVILKKLSLQSKLESIL